MPELERPKAVGRRNEVSYKRLMALRTMMKERMKTPAELAIMKIALKPVHPRDVSKNEVPKGFPYPDMFFGDFEETRRLYRTFQSNIQGMRRDAAVRSAATFLSRHRHRTEMNIQIAVNKLIETNQKPYVKVTIVNSFEETGLSGWGDSIEAHLSASWGTVCDKHQGPFGRLTNGLLVACHKVGATSEGFPVCRVRYYKISYKPKKRDLDLKEFDALMAYVPNTELMVIGTKFFEVRDRIRALMVEARKVSLLRAI